MQFPKTLVWVMNLWGSIGPNLNPPNQDFTTAIQEPSSLPLPSLQPLPISPTEQSPFNTNPEVLQKPNPSSPLPPLCKFHTPKEKTSTLILSSKTWAFISALLSHRIQAYSALGESRIESIDVWGELGGFEVDLVDKELEEDGGSEGGLGELRLRSEEEGEREGKLWLGLVYEGAGSTNIESEGEGEGMKECIENAIRGVYEGKDGSGWMGLGDGEGVGSGEWVSYLVYRDGEGGEGEE